MCQRPERALRLKLNSPKYATCGVKRIGAAPFPEKSKGLRRGQYPMAALARKASLSDRSAQKIRNDVQGDWLTAGAAGGES
jgi:hypothetical protein